MILIGHFWCSADIKMNTDQNDDEVQEEDEEVNPADWFGILRRT